VFLGHGTDDAFVDVELGRQARGVLSRAGCIVEWKEYAGAEQEGHWLKAPEEMDDIAHFLQRIELMSQI
jgi:predicted esterase